MEIEKVIRIIGTFIVAATLAMFIAMRLIFKDSSHILSWAAVITSLLSLCAIWAEKLKSAGKNSRKSCQSNTTIK